MGSCSWPVLISPYQTSKIARTTVDLPVLFWAVLLPSHAGMAHALALALKMLREHQKLWSRPREVCRNKSVTFCSSGTKTFLAFLIIGCGFRSSSVNLCLRGLKSSPPGTLDSTKSAGSGLKFTSTSTQSGSMGLGVFLSFCGGDSGNNTRSYNTFSRMKRTEKPAWLPLFTVLLWAVINSIVWYFLKVHLVLYSCWYREKLRNPVCNTNSRNIC